MADRELARILHQVRVAAAVGLTDQELLRRYVVSRDGAAFELLVRRHAGTVFGVCQRVLGEVHDAEDAFQATVLILARKAAGIRTRTSLACWLHKVAYRVALTLRAERARKRVLEQSLLGIDNVPGRPAELGSLERVELRDTLDEEVNRLPERFRAPIVLCLLEGRTVQEAALELGVPRGTIASRLARARQRLRKRLTERGLVVAAALTAINESAAAWRPLVLAAAVTPRVIPLPGVNPSPAVATLTRKVLQTMLLQTLWIKGSMAAILIGLVLAGGGLFLGLRANALGQSGPVEEIVGAQPPQQTQLIENQQPIADTAVRRVPVVHPQERKAAPTLDFTSRLEARQTVEIRPQVSGRLERICFKPGADVKKGDLLFQIDAETYRLDLLKAEADVAVLEAKLSQTQVELKRAAELLRKQLMAQEQVDRFAAQADADQSAVKAARVEVERAKLRMAATQITAPISGRVGRALVDVGNQVYSEGDHRTVLARITTLDPIGLSFDLDERSFLRYQRQMQAGEVKGPGSSLGIGLGDQDGIPNGFPLQGTLESFEDRINPETGKIRVHATLPNKAKLLLPGMYARIRMFFGPPRTLLEVPDSAVRVAHNRHYVWVITDQNRVRPRRINIGSFEGQMLVEEGLRPDDWVVTDAKALSEGERVQPERVTGSSPSKN
jgi:multidrug efflux system membrane fusion protein